MSAEVPALMKSGDEAATLGNPDYPKLIWGCFRSGLMATVSAVLFKGSVPGFEFLGKIP